MNSNPSLAGIIRIYQQDIRKRLQRKSMADGLFVEELMKL